MRMFHKIFLCFVVLFSITFQVAGFFLLRFAYENAITQEKRYALQVYQYNKFVLQSLMLTQAEYEAKQFTANVGIFDADGESLINSLKGEKLWKLQNEDTICFRTSEKDGLLYIYVYGGVKQNHQTVYLVTETDITQIVEQQRQEQAFFHKVFILILILAFPIIWFLSRYFTKNIELVNKGAKTIADGDYSQRIAVLGKDEIGELAMNFNQMAETVEQKVNQLSHEAKVKEDFVANFAHEIKTPMTSVIGYADMIYQKELSGEQVKSASKYILNEAMRLEVLSQKLMELFVLQKQDFTLEKTNLQEFFSSIKADLQMVCQIKEVEVKLEIEHGDVLLDWDLCKMMIMNIVDNSLKADCKSIYIRGCCEEGGYRLRLTDDGKGIPPKEIPRVTEAFYMVDKSRSRKQHGAGLGMALVAKATQIHGASLELESDGTTGTSVVLFFERGQQS